MDDPPRRVHYFAGRLLTAEDLEAEQTYHRQMRYLTNRLHGHGIVLGLDIALAGSQVEVSPGLAIDPLGRELPLTEPQGVPLSGLRAGRAEAQDLVLVWGEDLEGLVPVPAGGTQAAWVVERPRAQLSPTDDVPEQAVVLARLSRIRRDVSIDLSVRHLWGG